MDAGLMKILVLGGYGVFGGRLVELLSDVAEIELLICGRSLVRAEAFCAGHRGEAHLRPVALDRVDIAEGLRAHAPNLVVDASGPFQNYGDCRYDVIAACIDAGIDYLDFADAADFVFGVSQFDSQAKAAGVFVLSGVSSFPVLTAAVLREIAKRMDIVAVEGGIAPSPYAGIGLNVMRAVLSYAGAPVKLWRDGKPTHGVGLAESMRFTIAVPGRLPLRNTHFSLVDVPDLRLIPPDHSSITDIWMGAGPAPEILHRLLNLLAKARARLHLPSLGPLSSLFYFVLNRLRFGEHRGGMFVRARGKSDGDAMQISWHLLAEGDDGPYIPSMAIEAVVRQLLRGRRPLPGCRPGTHALDLADYDALFRSRTIFTGFRIGSDPDAPLYRALLGSAFDDLPSRLREIHDGQDTRQWTGTAHVRRGRGVLARMISSILGFPETTTNVPLHVTFLPEKGTERWTRNFGGKVFSSVQSRGSGRDQYLLVERFGVISVALALVLEGGRLYIVPRRWRLAGIPMPNFLLPSGSTFEYEDKDQFCFNVNISAPFVGLITSYSGTLNPVV